MIYRNTEVLNDLRRRNPSCTINSSNLSHITIGENVAILDDVYLKEVVISDFSYISNFSRLNNVHIGKFCSIGPHVQIGLAPHPSRRFVSTYPAFYSHHNSGCPLAFRDDKIYDDRIPKTFIANDVWIGSNVMIPGGIAIGTGAIVAAGSVVVKDVPSYAIVGGNPAKIIRYRFSNEQIDSVLASEWWNWPKEKILRNLVRFSDVEKFMEGDCQ